MSKLSSRMLVCDQCQATNPLGHESCSICYARLNLQHQISLSELSNEASKTRPGEYLSPRALLVVTVIACVGLAILTRIGLLSVGISFLGVYLILIAILIFASALRYRVRRIRGEEFGKEHLLYTLGTTFVVSVYAVLLIMSFIIAIFVISTHTALH